MMHPEGRPFNASTYKNHGCRCALCRAAATNYTREQRHKPNSRAYANQRRRENARGRALYRLAAMFPREFRRLWDDELGRLDDAAG